MKSEAKTSSSKNTEGQNKKHRGATTQNTEGQNKKH